MWKADLLSLSSLFSWLSFRAKRRICFSSKTTPTADSSSHSLLGMTKVGGVLLTLGLVPLLRAQSPELLSGPMQAKVTTACLECHESRIIIQQRLSKGAWTKEVDKMIKWGAVVDPAARDGFIEYLSKNFPPDKAPEQMPRVSAARKR